MKKVETLIRSNTPYVKSGNVIHFILNESDRPYWSKALNSHLETNKIDLNMRQRYREQKEIMEKDENRKQFIDFLSKKDGVKVDLASGPSGYFSPMLDTLLVNDIFIITDACPAVIAAHSSACDKPNCYVFDMDLDKELPFLDNSIGTFSGNMLNNVNNYKELIQEIYRCLKQGGRFAVIEIFYESGGKTSKQLQSQKSVCSSLENFINFCSGIGFRYIDSKILCTRKGKIAEGDLYPLGENEESEERSIYFEKPL